MIRFRLRHNGIYEKNQDLVNCPDVLELKNKRYDLCSIVNHYGSRIGGHYTSCSKVENR